MKNKNTLLYDFMEIYKKIECDGLTIPCHECKNKNLCDIVGYVIKNIGNLYNESKQKLTQLYTENLLMR